VWRTGADAATQLSTTAPIELAGVALRPGTYTLFTLPTRSGVYLVISGDKGEWGTEYDPARDIARRPVTVDATSRNVERFTISVGGSPSSLVLEWGTFRWSVPIHTRQG